MICFFTDDQTIGINCSAFLNQKASLALLIEYRFEKIFSLGINCMSLAVSVVRRGQEMFCGCCRFGFVVRVIYSTAVFIKSVF